MQMSNNPDMISAKVRKRKKVVDGGDLKGKLKKKGKHYLQLNSRRLTSIISSSSEHQLYVLYVDKESCHVLKIICSYKIILQI